MVPLWPIWTIMVAAKLDRSRVLVTKFHQNRSTVKGRSAGQRHTHRHTNSAENKGPSGLQSGQYTVITTLRNGCRGRSNKVTLKNKARGQETERTFPKIVYSWETAVIC